jgi:hypothetical protein
MGIHTNGCPLCIYVNFVQIKIQSQCALSPGGADGPERLLARLGCLEALGSRAEPGPLQRVLGRRMQSYFMNASAKKVLLKLCKTQLGKPLMRF